VIAFCSTLGAGGGGTDISIFCLLKRNDYNNMYLTDRANS
jgi:hypothetical protein